MELVDGGRVEADLNVVTLGRYCRLPQARSQADLLTRWICELCACSAVHASVCRAPTRLRILGCSAAARLPKCRINASSAVAGGGRL